MRKRNFTLDEANEILPKLESLLLELLKKRESYSRAHDALFVHELVCEAEKTEGLAGEEDDLEENIKFLEESIEGLADDIGKILSFGCILKNIETGSVDFLGEHKGEKVYFSWRVGEESIKHYRLLKDSSSKRIPI